MRIEENDMAAAKEGSDSYLLTDLALELLHHELRPVYRVATEERRSAGSSSRRFTDFSTVTGRENLAQAVKIRLLTRRGELAALAHPEFGSRLHELVGRPNTENTRNLVRLYILEALAREPRIEKIVHIEVNQVPGTMDQLSVRLEIKPVGSTSTVTVQGLTLAL